MKKHFTIYADESVMKKMRLICVHLEVSQSEFIETAIKNEMDKRKICNDSQVLIKEQGE